MIIRGSITEMLSGLNIALMPILIINIIGTKPKKKIIISMLKQTISTLKQPAYMLIYKEEILTIYLKV